MKKVCIHFYSGKGFLSRLIRWQTRSKFSHTSISIDKRFWESNPPKVSTCDLSYAMKKRKPSLTTEINIKDIEAMEMVKWLDGQVGKKYDFTMVIRFVTRQQEARKSKGKFFCSELIGAAFKHIGVDLFRETDPWEISPGFLSRSPLLK